MFEHLGVIVNAEGAPINHRSILKVCVNPILRFFGFCIATNSNGAHIGAPVLIKQRRTKTIRWLRYKLPVDCTIIKKRRII